MKEDDAGVLSIVTYSTVRSEEKIDSKPNKGLSTVLCPLGFHLLQKK